MTHTLAELDILVGALTEAQNDKADLDLNNVSLTNDNIAQLRHLMCDLDFNNAINVTASTNDAVSYYTAPSDGIFAGLSYGTGKFAINGVKLTSDASTATERCSLLWFPLNKGDVITYWGGNWGGAGNQKFIPFKRQAGTNVKLLAGLTYQGKYTTVEDLQAVTAVNGKWALVGNDTDGYNRYFTRPIDGTFNTYEWADGGKDISTGDYVVDHWADANNWYRLYNSGWCEQGGYVRNAGNTTGVVYTITLLKPYRDANYFISMWAGVGDSGWQYAGGVGYGNAGSGYNVRPDYNTNSSFTYFNATGTNGTPIFWETKGYT